MNLKDCIFNIEKYTVNKKQNTILNLPFNLQAHRFIELITVLLVLMGLRLPIRDDRCT